MKVCILVVSELSHAQYPWLSVVLGGYMNDFTPSNLRPAIHVILLPTLEFVLTAPTFLTSSTISPPRPGYHCLASLRRHPLHLPTLPLPLILALPTPSRPQDPGRDPRLHEPHRCPRLDPRALCCPPGTKSSTASPPPPTTSPTPSAASLASTPLWRRRLPNHLLRLPLASLAPSPASTPAGQPSGRSSSPSFRMALHSTRGCTSACSIGALCTSHTITSSAVAAAGVSPHSFSISLCPTSCVQRVVVRNRFKLSSMILKCGTDEFASDTAESPSCIDHQILMIPVHRATASLSGNTRCRRARHAAQAYLSLLQRDRVQQIRSSCCPGRSRAPNYGPCPLRSSGWSFQTQKLHLWTEWCW